MSEGVKGECEGSERRGEGKRGKKGGKKKGEFSISITGVSCCNSQCR